MPLVHDELYSPTNGHPDYHACEQSGYEYIELATSMAIIWRSAIGKLRLGADELLVDTEGVSKISMEDVAIVLLDEAERPRLQRSRFTAAY